MGKQKGIYLHGKEGNVLYYSWKGLPCLRTIPATVYQSPVVIPHKNANGLSTKMGASFRRMLADILPYPKNMKMQTAVRIALLKWLKAGPVSAEPPVNIPFIGELSFNEASTLKDFLKLPLTLALTGPGELSLQIPGMIPATAFGAPSNTTGIQFKIALACCHITSGEALNNYYHYISIPYNSTRIPPQTISFPIQIPADSLTIVAAGLDYFTTENGVAAVITNERFRPSQVIGTLVRVSK